MRKTKGSARRRAQKERRGYGRRLLKGLALLSVLGGAAYGGAVLWTHARTLPLFRCSGIYVAGNALIPSDELLANVVLPDSAGIFDIDLGAVADSVRRHPYVASCSVGRRVPSRLKATVREREPVAYVMLGTACLIDTAGVLLPLPSSGTALDLPVITGVKKRTPRYGRVLEAPGVAGALAFITGAAGTRAGTLERISEVDVSRAGILCIRTTSPSLSVLVNADPSSETLRNWHVIERHAGDDLDGIRYIDLRFKNQIIIKRRS